MGDNTGCQIILYYVDIHVPEKTHISEMTIIWSITCTQCVLKSRRFIDNMDKEPKPCLVQNIPAEEASRTSGQYMQANTKMNIIQIQRCRPPFVQQHDKERNLNLDT